MISHYITMCVRLVRFVPIYATFFRPRQTYYQPWKPGQKVARFHAGASWGVRRWWFARARLGYRRVHGVIPGLRAHIGRTGSIGDMTVMIYRQLHHPGVSNIFQRSLHGDHGDWYPTCWVKDTEAPEKQHGVGGNESVGCPSRAIVMASTSSDGMLNTLWVSFYT